MKPGHGPPTSRRAALRLLGSVGAISALAGCAATRPRPAVASEDWHDVALPGKPRTQYRWETLPEGRVLVAKADRSASLYRRRLSTPLPAVSDVEFSWWVQSLPDGGDVSDAEATDAAARVLLSFGGDHARLSPRTQAMFELARSLTGELPPYATLAYVWDRAAPVGRMVVHPRSERVRKIVVESGPAGLGQWRRYRRRVAADYAAAFGEAPGPLLSVAVMTDGDNTRSTLLTRYGEIAWR